MLCVARTLNDRVDVPLGGYQADFEACFGIDVTAGGKIYRTYNILLLLFSFLFMYSLSENLPD